MVIDSSVVLEIEAKNATSSATRHQDPLPRLELNRKHRLTKDLTQKWKISPRQNRTPFFFHVSNETGQQCPANSIDQGFQFQRLPIEIQFEVFKMCDQPTLFQLMRTCSSIRPEASRLFWSNKDVWYECSFLWLEYEGAKTGPALHCPDFAKNVQQVEIKVDGKTHPCPGLFEQDDSPIHEDDDDILCFHRRLLATTEQIRFFWSSFKRVFPSCRRVIFDQRSQACCLDSYIEVISERPPTIDCLVSTWPCRVSASNRRRAKKVLWTFKPCDPTWYALSGSWENNLVVMPPKLFRGIMGNFQHQLYLDDRIWNERAALRMLRLRRHEWFYHRERGPQLETSEKWGIECPNPDCDLFFECIGQWTQHACETSHDLDYSQKPLRYLDISGFPGDWEATLRLISEDLLKVEVLIRRQDIKNYLLHLGHAANEAITFQAMQQQFDTDPIYAHETSARTSLLAQDWASSWLKSPEEVIEKHSDWLDKDFLHSISERWSRLVSPEKGV
ncbi:hypothetical protein BT63DRAFT_429484 [Microthyrium microscopicum]|uniref:F-box domain-containing protein n=1 Tax=Microthyrium microscopicum TaxID=703497 RepID=A0A6A6U1C9_9PEZI|nr:hypothetical protein BT63DRAFT_429484 [Microthyrium microscopicum]